MKNKKSFLISLAFVILFVCSINWSYVMKLFDMTKEAALEMATDEGTAQQQLNYEMDHMTVWNFINPKIMKFIPKPGDPVPEPQITPTPAPSDDFDIKKVHDKLKTDPNTAFFWSGTTTDKSGKKWGGKDRAREIAESRGGVTLEMVMEKNHVDPPAYDPNDPKSEKNWRDISQAYAEQASGEVWAVIGQDLRVGNIWERLEFLVLQVNPNVTKVTLIDPYTLEEKVLLDRTN